MVQWCGMKRIEAPPPIQIWIQNRITQSTLNQRHLKSSRNDEDPCLHGLAGLFFWGISQSPQIQLQLQNIQNTPVMSQHQNPSFMLITHVNLR